MPNDEEQQVPAELEDLEKFARAMQRNRRLLLTKPNVIAMDVGYRVRGGELTDERVVKVYVAEKLARDDLAEDELIPQALRIDDEEVPVDVEESSIPQPITFTLRSRPLRGGSSISTATGGTGTLGICVTLNDSNVFVLSCDHVIGVSAGQVAGANIFQPSLGDGGVVANDLVATLFTTAPPNFGLLPGPVPIPFPSVVDAALGQVVGGNQFNLGNREVHWLGYPNLLPGFLWTPAKLGSLIGRRVCKMGRTTEFTVGTIQSVFWSGFVGPYPNGQNAWFANQISIAGEGAFVNRFAARGDSGSLVVDFATQEPISLVFAVGPSLAFANRLDFVMRSLGIPQL